MDGSKKAVVGQRSQQQKDHILELDGNSDCYNDLQIQVVIISIFPSKV